MASAPASRSKQYYGTLSSERSPRMGTMRIFCAPRAVLEEVEVVGAAYSLEMTHNTVPLSS